MGAKDSHREKLKSLFDKWNTEIEIWEDVQAESADELKDLKQDLKNTWAAFEQRVD